MNGRTRRAKGTVAVALAGCLAFLLGGCGSGTTDVVVTPVQVGALTVTPGARGVLAPVKEASVTPARRGTVVSLMVAAGQHVEAGQQVAVVRVTGPSTEQQALASQLEGLQTLLQAQKTSTGPYSSAVADTLVRIAAVRQQLAGVIGTPDVLTAPQAGTVTALNAGAGSEVDSTKPLMRIGDLSSMQMTVTLAAEYRTVVHVGDHADLVVAGSGGRDVPATVTALVPLTQADSGFQVTVTAANTDAAMTAGTSTYLRLQQSIPQAVRVPTRAVLGTSVKPYVYVVDKGRASLVSATFGPSDGTWTQVLSGLEPGQRVVFAGNQGLVDGEAVRVSGEQVPS